MAGSVNKVILLGNVGKDPEIKATQNGSKLASFSIATSKRWKDKQTQEYKDKTEWHKVVIFGEGLVDIVEKYVKKGSKIYIEGEISTRKWSDQQGNDRYTTEVILQGYNSTLTLLDNRGSNNQSIENKTDDNSLTENTETSNDSNIDDDIPF
tara:strand:- start:845 stop:1300 length:456 start_codon:yes stop_codon:yes gene_type:complete